MNAPVPDPRKLALQRFRTFARDWLAGHDESDRAPDQACAMLAAWAGLSRLIEPLAWPLELTNLTVPLRQDWPALLRAFLESPSPVDWLQDAAELDQAWDTTNRDDVLNELDSAAVALFDRLDAQQLAVYQARRLAEDDNSASEPLAEWHRQLGAAEDFFADHADAFLPAAPGAAALLAAFRSDLDEADFELWQTTLKHRRLEELQEDLEAAPNLLPPALPAAPVTLKIRRSNQEVTAHPRSRLRRPAFAAAATGESLPATQLLWRSDSGTIEARLMLPTVSGLPARLAFYLVASGQPALALAGQLVSLAGLPLTLDARARVDFNEQELVDAGQDLLLEVAGQPWQARTPEAQ